MTEVALRRRPATSGISLESRPTIRITDDINNITGGSVLAWPDANLGTGSWLPLLESLRHLADDPIGGYTIVVTGASTGYFATARESTSDQPAPDYEMLRLETAAQAGNEREFLATYRRMNWSRRSPEDIMQAVQWALAAGAHLAARNLSARGAALYPGHAELQKYARVLAPPRTVRRTPADPSVKANHDWLVKHGAQYRGKWVAIQNGDLLAVADSFLALKSKTGDARNALFTKVF